MFCNRKLKILEFASENRAFMDGVSLLEEIYKKEIW